MSARRVRVRGLDGYTEEFTATRPAFRWRQMIALARVTASEYGYAAPGYKQACELLGVS